MMLHGEEDHLALADQVEHKIVVHYEFAQIVSFVEEFAQIFGERIRFGLFHCAG
jgi:hypothetical protein